jgi:hypothetical protein
MFIFSTEMGNETLAKEDIHFNQIKFATGLMVMVVMTAAKFGKRQSGKAKVRVAAKRPAVKTVAKRK